MSFIFYCDGFRHHLKRNYFDASLPKIKSKILWMIEIAITYFFEALMFQMGFLVIAEEYKHQKKCRQIRLYKFL